MIAIDVILTARIFLNFIGRFSQNPGSGVSERPGIKLGVRDQSIYVNVVVVRPRPALSYVQRVTVRAAAVFVRPHFFVFEPEGIDDECISFPMTELLAEERRIRIVRMLCAWRRQGMRR